MADATGPPKGKTPKHLQYPGPKRAEQKRGTALLGNWKPATKAIRGKHIKYSDVRETIYNAEKQQRKLECIVRMRPQARSAKKEEKVELRPKKDDETNQPDSSEEYLGEELEKMLLTPIEKDTLYRSFLDVASDGYMRKSQVWEWTKSVHLEEWIGPKDMITAFINTNTGRSSTDALTSSTLSYEEFVQLVVAVISMCEERYEPDWTGADKRATVPPNEPRLIRRLRDVLQEGRMYRPPIPRKPKHYQYTCNLAISRAVEEHKRSTETQETKAVREAEEAVAPTAGISRLDSMQSNWA